jgi:F-type H+-transporting ATPase subunit epsilon
MTVEVVTPERVVYSGQAEMVIARGVNGELGIMPNHMPLVTPLKTAPVQIKVEGDQVERMAVSGGFMEVRGDKVTILAETAEKPGDIDVERAKAAKERAEKRLAERYPEIDVQRAERALQRAQARLDVAK